MSDVKYLLGHPELAPTSIFVVDSGLRLLPAHTRAILHKDLIKIQVNAARSGDSDVNLFEGILDHSKLKHVHLLYKTAMFLPHRLILRSNVSASLSTLFLESGTLGRQEVILFSRALSSNTHLNDLKMRYVIFQHNLSLSNFLYCLPGSSIHQILWRFQFFKSQTLFLLARSVSRMTKFIRNDAEEFDLEFDVAPIVNRPEVKNFLHTASRALGRVKVHYLPIHINGVFREYLTETFSNIEW